MDKLGTMCEIVESECKLGERQVGGVAETTKYKSMGANPLKMDKKESLKELIAYCNSKGFIWGPEPEIYGGMAGFYTFGPMGKLLKNNVEDMIRKVFQANGFWEVECPIVTPEKVWEASGHVSGFNDTLIKCKKCMFI